MMYAIGMPGEINPRFRGSTDPADIPLMMQPGEVAVPWDTPQPGAISADGASFVPAVPCLAECKAVRWEAAKNVRYSMTHGGCDVPGIGRVDTKVMPQKNSPALISAAALSALRAKLAGEPWSRTWTLADQSAAVVDADAMLAIGAAVDAHIEACHAAGAAIRALIDAAEDEAALAAIDITAGYPAQA